MVEVEETAEARATGDGAIGPVVIRRIIRPSSPSLTQPLPGRCQVSALAWCYQSSLYRAAEFGASTTGTIEPA